METALSAGGNELEPDVQETGKRAQTKPLECVAMMFVNACSDNGPRPSQSIVGVARLDNRQVQQGHIPFAGKRLQVDILPDRTSARLPEFV
jgi:hypothetical protein